MQERILCSAIWVKHTDRIMVHKPRNIEYGMVFCGYRHCDCIEMMSYQYPKFITVKYGIEQGFLTNKKRFVDRVEAKAIATEAEQLLERASNSDELFSEDIY